MTFHAGQEQPNSEEPHLPESRGPFSHHSRSVNRHRKGIIFLGDEGITFMTWCVTTETYTHGWTSNSFEWVDDLSFYKNVHMVNAVRKNASLGTVLNL